MVSSYSSSAAAACRKIDRFKLDGADYYFLSRCKGAGGYFLFITEDDLRQTVTVGRGAAQAMREPAASQGFGPFNLAHDTVEWRSLPSGKPFAIIQRWTIADNENPDPKTHRPASLPFLIVTRLPPGPVCHVAYVDAGANSKANELARRAADELARAFDCGRDRVRVIGEEGRAAELAIASRKHEPK